MVAGTLVSATLFVLVAAHGASGGLVAQGRPGTQDQIRPGPSHGIPADGAAAAADGFFKAMDKDRDGLVSFKEFKAMVLHSAPGGQGCDSLEQGWEGPGVPPLTQAQRADLEAMQRQLGAKRRELEGAFAAKYPELDAKRNSSLKGAFDSMDVTGDGKLSRDEFAPPDPPISAGQSGPRARRLP